MQVEQSGIANITAFGHALNNAFPTQVIITNVLLNCLAFFFDNQIKVGLEQFQAILGLIDRQAFGSIVGGGFPHVGVVLSDVIFATWIAESGYCKLTVFNVIPQPTESIKSRKKGENDLYLSNTSDIVFLLLKAAG